MTKSKIAIIIIVVWVVINVYVTFFQEKILLIGDWPHEEHKQNYGDILKKYAWSASVSFIKLNGNNKYDIVYIHIPEDIIEFRGNYEVIKRLCNDSQIVILE